MSGTFDCFPLYYLFVSYLHKALRLTLELKVTGKLSLHYFLHRCQILETQILMLAQKNFTNCALSSSVSISLFFHLV